jgi:SAM-dependent methyltransferase
MSKDAASSHWGRYWAAGPLTSLPQDFQGNYGGEIADFWRGVMQAFAGRNAQVLDLCTGNGAVALLAAEFLPDAEISAIDAAAINPGAAVQYRPDLVTLLKRIRFQPETPVESFAAAPESYDLVTSQYGLEYTDWQASAAQIGRLLRPGGQLALVVHSPRSQMAERMTQEAQEYQHLARSGFIEALLACAEQRLDVAGLRTALTNAQAVLSASPGSELLMSVSQSCQALLAMPDQQLVAQGPSMGAYANELQAGQHRLDDMLGVNRALADNPDWHKVFEAQGLDLQRSQALRFAGQHDCGTALVFEKSTS